MFGYSFTKLILLAGTVAAVRYSCKFFGQLDERREEKLASSRAATSAKMKDDGTWWNAPNTTPMGLIRAQ